MCRPAILIPSVSVQVRTTVWTFHVMKEPYVNPSCLFLTPSSNHNGWIFGGCFLLMGNKASSVSQFSMRQIKLCRIFGTKGDVVTHGQFKAKGPISIISGNKFHHIIKKKPCKARSITLFLGKLFKKYLFAIFCNYLLPREVVFFTVLWYHHDSFRPCVCRVIKLQTSKTPWILRRSGSTMDIAVDALVKIDAVIDLLTSGFA